MQDRLLMFFAADDTIRSEKDFNHLVEFLPEILFHAIFQLFFNALNLESVFTEATDGHRCGSMATQPA